MTGKDKSYSSFSFLGCGSAEGEANCDGSGICKDEGDKKFLDEVELNCFLASLSIYSGSGTPRCRGDEWFSLVLSFLVGIIAFF